MTTCTSPWQAASMSPVSQHDSETVVEGRVIGWIGRHVWVELDDARLGPLATWLDASDVHR